MTGAQAAKTLLEIETIETRLELIARAVMRGDAHRIEPELRDLARATGGLAKAVRMLYEHVHAQEEAPQAEAPAVLSGVSGG